MGWGAGFNFIRTIFVAVPDQIPDDLQRPQPGAVTLDLLDVDLLMREQVKVTLAAWAAIDRLPWHRDSKGAAFQ